MSKVEELSVIRVNSAVEGTAGSRVWMVKWNHTGSLLASCGDDKAVRIWRKTSNKPLLECCSTLDDSHSRAVRCVEFSHCGRYLASASFDASIIIYTVEEADGVGDNETLARVRQVNYGGLQLLAAEDRRGEFAENNKLEGHESEVKCCAFSPSDEFLATCSRDKSVWFWQMDEDDDFQVCSVLQQHTQDVKFVAWHPNEELLVSCSYDYSIVFYKFDGEDWITQQKIPDAHDGTVWCAAFDSEGQRLVTVGEDCVVQLWKRCSLLETATNDKWRSVAKFKVENSWLPLYSVSWHAITGLIATGGADGIIRFFRIVGTGDSEQLVQVATIDADANEVNCVAWSPSISSDELSDKWILASCFDDGSIRLFGVSL